jgi:hypothetical protein
VEREAEASRVAVTETGRSTRLPGPGSIGGRGWTRSRGVVVELVCFGLRTFLGKITGVHRAYCWVVLRPMMAQLLIRYSGRLVT